MPFRNFTIYGRREILLPADPKATGTRGASLRAWGFTEGPMGFDRFPDPTPAEHRLERWLEADGMIGGAEEDNLDHVVAGSSATAIAVLVPARWTYYRYCPNHRDFTVLVCDEIGDPRFVVRATHVLWNSAELTMRVRGEDSKVDHVIFHPERIRAFVALGEVRG
jgi:hypothetical protein